MHIYLEIGREKRLLFTKHQSMLTSIGHAVKDCYSGSEEERKKKIKKEKKKFF